MTVSYGFHSAMTAQPGKGDDLIAFLLKAPSLSNEDCVVFLVGRSASNPDIIYVTEGWTTEDAHDRFFVTDEAKTLVAQLQPLLAGEPQYIDELPIGGKADF
jgi:quinol monooxygenase YgiN